MAAYSPMRGVSQRGSVVKSNSFKNNLSNSCLREYITKPAYARAFLSRIKLVFNIFTI